MGLLALRVLREFPATAPLECPENVERAGLLVCRVMLDLTALAASTERLEHIEQAGQRQVRRKSLDLSAMLPP